MRNVPVRIAVALAIFGATSAYAQDAETVHIIRESVRSGQEAFMRSGAPALQRRIENCYAHLDPQPDETAFRREAMRCVSYEQLGQILFTSHRLTMEKLGTPFDDPFFNPAAQEPRIFNFLTGGGPGAADAKKMSNRIFALAYDEFVKPAAAAAATRLPRPQPR